MGCFERSFQITTMRRSGFFLLLIGKNLAISGSVIPLCTNVYFTTWLDRVLIVFCMALVMRSGFFARDWIKNGHDPGASL